MGDVTVAVDESLPGDRCGVAWFDGREASVAACVRGGLGTAFPGLTGAICAIPDGAVEVETGAGRVTADAVLAGPHPYDAVDRIEAAAVGPDDVGDDVAVVACADDYCVLRGAGDDTAAALVDGALLESAHHGVSGERYGLEGRIVGVDGGDEVPPVEFVSPAGGLSMRIDLGGVTVGFVRGESVREVEHDAVGDVGFVSREGDRGVRRLAGAVRRAARGRESDRGR